MPRHLRLTLWALMAAFVVLAMPVAAFAAKWEVARAPTADGPGLALTGDRVAWMQRRGDGAGADLYVARPGGDPHRVQGFPADPGGGRDRFELAASPSRVALLRRRRDQLDVFAGPVGSRLTRIERCTASVSSSGIDVSEQLVAFPRCDGKLVVRDLDGAREDAVLGAVASNAQLAGRYVTWVETGVGDRPEIVVYDRDADAVSYVVRGVGVLPLGIQSNGKVAFALAAAGQGTEGLQVMGWATPRKPTVHRIHVATRFAYFPRIVDGRVAFGRDAVKATESRKREVGITDLWSGRAQILSQRLTAATTVDFDGETIAYAEWRGDHGARIRTRALPPPEPSR